MSTTENFPDEAITSIPSEADDNNSSATYKNISTWTSLLESVLMTTTENVRSGVTEWVSSDAVQSTVSAAAATVGGNASLSTVSAEMADNVTGMVEIWTDETTIRSPVDIPYGSDAELVFLLIYMIAITLAVVLGNGAFLAVVTVTEQLHTKHYFLLCMNAINDMFLNATYMPTGIVIALKEDIKSQLNTDIIRWVLSVPLISFASQFTLVSLISLERLIFFVHPMKYDRLVTRKTMAAALVFCYLCGFAFSFGTELGIGRFITITHLTAVVPAKAGYDMIFLCAFTLPSIFITAISATRIYWLVVKKNQVAPGDIDVPLTDAQKAVRRNAKISIKLIGIASGCLWLSSLPASIIRVVVSAYGYTYEDMDTRKSTAVSIASRISIFLFANFSAAANPWIYYFTHPELREKAQQLKSRATVGIMP